jgi:hypothetical protein
MVHPIPNASVCRKDVGIRIHAFLFVQGSVGEFAGIDLCKCLSIENQVKTRNWIGAWRRWQSILSIFLVLTFPFSPGLDLLLQGLDILLRGTIVGDGHVAISVVILPSIDIPVKFGGHGSVVYTRKVHYFLEHSTNLPRNPRIGTLPRTFREIPESGHSHEPSEKSPNRDTSTHPQIPPIFSFTN